MEWPLNVDGVERKLAALLSADGVGLMVAHDVTIPTLRAHHGESAELVGERRGPVVAAPLPNALAESAPKRSGAA